MSSTMIISMLGGLGLFLYGMKLMGEGIEKVAGSKMKTILEWCTKNRLIGVIVGTIFTAIIQSSSAATVMVVSFVNSGLMNLMQAVGVIMGANIGTTVTAQIVAFDLDSIAPIFVITGVVMIMFFKNETVNKVGEVLFGFGALFLGMSLMKNSMADIKDSVAVMKMISSLKNPLVAILVGLVITTILQSSSASVGILVTMAGSGLVELPMCFYVILGCNIGACTSAVLVGLTGKKDAKRAALIHLMFNIIGSIIMLLILLPFGGYVEHWINAISADPKRAVANTHTIFKVFQVIILFPFAGWIVKLTQWLVPGEDEQKEKYELKYISLDSAVSPAIAMIEVTNEIKRMGEIANYNLERSMEALMKGNKDIINEVFEREHEVDFLSRKITDFLVKINQMLPVSETKNIAGYYHVVSDIERIGDHAENIAEFAQTKLNESIEFSKVGAEELQHMFDVMNKEVKLALEAFTERNEEHLKEIMDLENEVDDLEKQLQRNHVRRMAKNECSPKAAIFSDLISNFERVSDHATNIAFATFREEEYI
ncbi:MAG: Na/Pi cotransporter family protein [Clostridiales bacterium]|nr:Na/Pi cotransporter family protein [Clostridiales bacterium]MDD6292652.1 Na/Pi cotransporter family protein [Eubacteriales bacterium]